MKGGVSCTVLVDVMRFQNYNNLLLSMQCKMVVSEALQVINGIPPIDPQIGECVKRYERRLGTTAQNDCE